MAMLAGHPVQVPQICSLCHHLGPDLKLVELKNTSTVQKGFIEIYAQSLREQYVCFLHRMNVTCGVRFLF